MSIARADERASGAETEGAATPSSLLDAPDEAAGQPVSAREAAFFKENGYLIKRGLLDRASLEPALDYIWERAPDCIDRHAPSTYADAHRLWERTPGNGEPGGDLNHFGGARGDNGIWQLLSSGPTGLGTEPFMLQLVPNSPQVQAVVAALIGTPVCPCRRTRGVYTRFPTPPPYDPIRPHWDSCGHQLGGMALLEDCPPTGGCFTFWPGSHRRLFPLFTTSQGNTPKDNTRAPEGHMRSLTLRQTLADIAATIQPAEFDGHAGDVCFLHHRLAHAASPNRTRENVRFMLICDFQKDSSPSQPRTFYDDHTLGSWNEKTQCTEQFHVDTRKFREDEPPNPDDMWKDWAI